MNITPPTGITPTQATTYNDISRLQILTYPHENKRVHINTPDDEITRKINSILEPYKDECYCITFVGYSAMKYADNNLPGTIIRNKLEQCLQENPDKRLVLVCGATIDGIGMAYKIASEEKFKNILCIGIVSANVDLDERAIIASELNDSTLIKVPSAAINKWETEDENNYQYMLHATWVNGGELVTLSGGQIALKETEKAIEMGIKTTIIRFEPGNLNGKPYETACAVNTKYFTT